MEEFIRGVVGEIGADEVVDEAAGRCGVGTHTQYRTSLAISAMTHCRHLLLLQHLVTLASLGNVGIPIVMRGWVSLQAAASVSGGNRYGIIENQRRLANSDREPAEQPPITASLLTHSLGCV